MKSLSLYDLENRKMNKPIVLSIIINKDNWKKDDVINKYKYIYKDGHISENDIVNLDIDDINIIEDIKDSYIDSIVVEKDGCFEIYAANIPLVDIPCKMIIIKEDN